MIKEEEFKKKLIDKLNTINQGWIDGDKEKTQNKKADIVNHQLKIAIEIKDDTHYKIEIPKTGQMITSGENLIEMNKHFTDDLRSANNKFKEYQKYKTVLLIRTEFPIIDIIRYSIEGINVYKIPSTEEGLEYIGKKTKYSNYIRKETGCYLIFNRDIFYFPNNFANQERIMEKKELEKIFDLKFKDVPRI